ncbi:2708_t:CDS:2, partial [Dentiscutata heterogama]
LYLSSRLATGVGRPNSASLRDSVEALSTFKVGSTVVEEGKFLNSPFEGLCIWLTTTPCDVVDTGELVKKQQWNYTQFA